MSFAITMVWRKPANHISNYYFCMNDHPLTPHPTPPSSNCKRNVKKEEMASGVSKKFHQLCSPVPLGEELTVPVTPESYTLDSDDDRDDDQNSAASAPSTSADSDFELPHSSPEPHLISQSELDDLVRDLELVKRKAELLGSRLQQWNLLENDVRISLSVIAKRIWFSSS